MKLISFSITTILLILVMGLANATGTYGCNASDWVRLF
jgi:hypothetical protein